LPQFFDAAAGSILAHVFAARLDLTVSDQAPELNAGAALSDRDGAGGPCHAHGVRGEAKINPA
jgi:hypothetical protein